MDPIFKQNHKDKEKGHLAATQGKGTENGFKGSSIPNLIATQEWTKAIKKNHYLGSKDFGMKTSEKSCHKISKEGPITKYIDRHKHAS